VSWHPQSWRDRPARQLPAYPDQLELETVQSCLASAAPLAAVAEVRALKAQLAEVAAGRAFLIQGGDCAETFAEFGADKVRLLFNLLLDLEAEVRGRAGLPVVKVGRVAGQFAKPRSAETETVGGETLPVWRGDIVNGAEFCTAARRPDPMRMLEAHRQARVTIDLLKAYAAAAYAPLSDLHRAARRRIGIAPEHALPTGSLARPVELFTSHEALLLPYEQALTRWDPVTERWWSASAHMLWLGDRTRQPDGAHVEFVRGIANPIEVKCGPGMDVDTLLRLVDLLDPANEPGRLVLIGRFGAQQAARHLPALMRATAAEGRALIWSVDPMHGNTISAGGRKTRLLPDLRSEVATFFQVAQAEGVRPGGIHLEMTGEDVTECLGGAGPTEVTALSGRYVTQCDPRLNPGQAREVVAAAARLLPAQAMSAAGGKRAAA